MQARNRRKMNLNSMIKSSRKILKRRELLSILMMMHLKEKIDSKSKNNNLLENMDLKISKMGLPGKMDLEAVHKEN